MTHGLQKRDRAARAEIERATPARQRPGAGVAAAASTAAHLLATRAAATAAVCSLALLTAATVARASDSTASSTSIADAGSRAPLSAANWQDVCARRAIFEWSRGSLPNAIDALEARAPGDAWGEFASDERALFLLGRAYLETGDVDALDALTEGVAAAAASGGGAAPWLTLWADADALAQPAPVGAAAAALRSVPEEASDLLAAYGVAHDTAVTAQRAAGDDAWRAIATRPGSSLLEQDIAGAARIRLATDALVRAPREAGEGSAPPPRAETTAADSIVAPVSSPEMDEAATILDGVPPASGFSARAQHMLGAIAIERGDVVAGRAALEALAAEHPGYAGRREVMRALGGLALRERRWDDAYAILAAIESDCRSESAALAQSAEECGRTGWRDPWRGAAPAGALACDRAPIDSISHARLGEALDAESPFGASAPPQLTLRIAGELREESGLPFLSVDAAAARARALSAHRDAQHALGAAAHRLALEETRIARAGEHVTRGRHVVAEIASELEGARAASSAAAERARALSEKLSRLCDRIAKDIVARGGEIARRAGRDADLARSLDYHFAQGPSRERRNPEAVVALDSVLAGEKSLDADLARFGTLVAERGPGLITRSYHDAWRGRLASMTEALEARAAADLARATMLADALDARGASLAADASLDALRAEVAARAIDADLAEARSDSVARATALAALTSARDAIDRELEGIEFGVIVAAQELAIREPDAAGRRTEALDRMRRFLADRAGAPARGEARFRLAELLALSGDFDARHEAAALYRAVLAEDTTFARQDAALYNLATLLLEDLSDEAPVHLTALLEHHPTSPFAQEAALRLADLRFETGEFDEATHLYERAAGGASPELSAIALYKLGWTHFRGERFHDAAVAFRDLLDRYDRDAAPHSADLEREAEEYLITALARAGGARAFAALYDDSAASVRAPRVLAGVAQLYARFSLFADAAAADSLWLERYPNHPEALAAASRWIAALDQSRQVEAARAARLALAPHFEPSRGWFAANDSTALRETAADFSVACYESVAVHHHRRALRDEKDRDAWRAALAVYEQVLAAWPGHRESPRLQLNASLTATGALDFERALVHADAVASSDSTRLAQEAEWQRVVIRDHWYESSRTAAAPGDSLLADAFLAEAEAFASRSSQGAGDGSERAKRSLDALWRAAGIALERAWHARGAAILETFLARGDADTRAPEAARLRAGALYESERFAEAALAFHAARKRVASQSDSTASALLEMAIVSEYLAVEQLPDDAERGARYVEFAKRWPETEHAPRALYEAGLAFRDARRAGDAVEAWHQLSDRYPRSAYGADARLAAAALRESEGDLREAALEFARFAEEMRDTTDAPKALVRAAELMASAGDAPASDSLLDLYVARYPNDRATAFVILEGRARREIDRLGSDAPISDVLRPSGAAGAPTSAVGAYLARAAAHPNDANAALLAEIAFRRAEEARVACGAARLTQPIRVSVAIKKSLLGHALAAYSECAAFGASPWDRAAAYRIGQTLVEFGDALASSERPAGLAGEDLAAYDDVIDEQAREFYSKGETAWTDLLARAADKEDDDDGGWIVEARCALEDRAGGANGEPAPLEEARAR